MLFTKWHLEASYMELHNMALLNALHFVLCIATISGIQWIISDTNQCQGNYLRQGCYGSYRMTPIITVRLKDCLVKTFYIKSM